MSTPTLPSIAGTSKTPINILLINPNSTPSMTQSCLRSLSQTLPENVTVTGFTAPPTAPTAIESRLDAVLSAADCIRALHPIINGPDNTVHYDAFLVACFSPHPLIAALREEYTQPCIGIMESTLYASRMLGEKLGILCTSPRSAELHARSIEIVYGLGAHSAGAVASGVGVLELECADSPRREEVHARLSEAARRLTEERGADCVCLGCAGMTEMQRICREAVGMGEGRCMVIDGVGVGVHFLTALVREGLRTAKGGSYRSSKEGREKRGQDYL